MSEELTVEQYCRMHSCYHPDDTGGHDPYNYVGPRHASKKRRTKIPLTKIETIIRRLKLTWANMKWLTRYDLSKEYHCYDYEGDLEGDYVPEMDNVC